MREQFIRDMVAAGIQVTKFTRLDGWTGPVVYGSLHAVRRATCVPVAHYRMGNASVIFPVLVPSESETDDVPSPHEPVLKGMSK
jgi:hypothetical protein